VKLPKTEFEAVLVYRMVQLACLLADAWGVAPLWTRNRWAYTGN